MRTMSFSDKTLDAQGGTGRPVPVGSSVGDMKRVLLGNEYPGEPEGPYSLGCRTVSSAGRQMFRPASVDGGMRL
jgi:hypothetical protein